MMGTFCLFVCLFWHHQKKQYCYVVEYKQDYDTPPTKEYSSPGKQLQNNNGERRTFRRCVCPLFEIITLSSRSQQRTFVLCPSFEIIGEIINGPITVTHDSRGPPDRAFQKSRIQRKALMKTSYGPPLIVVNPRLERNEGSILMCLQGPHKFALTCMRKHQQLTFDGK